MDDAELNKLFASCMPRLERTARQILRNLEDSEDALQEGLLQAFRNLNQFQGRSAFSTWLHSIVKNAARTHVRKMKCRPQCSSETELLDGSESTLEELSVDPGLSPEEECARRERSRILLEVVQELPSRFQAVVHLCDIDGLDGKDAARKLGITKTALKTSLFRARRLACQRIRGRFVPRGVLIPNSDLSRFQRSEVSEFTPAVGLVGESKRSQRDRNRMYTKSRVKMDVAGGDNESARRRSRFWKRGPAAPLHIALHNTHRPAC
jgi:RNA polymerase sigma-70 factor (ECF subfamily)